MPKPTTEQQIEALAVLRSYAEKVPRFVNPTVGEQAVADAINTLDNADLFATIDKAGWEREAEVEPCPIHPDEPDDAGCGEEADAAVMMASFRGVELTGALAPEHNIPHDRTRLEN